MDTTPGIRPDILEACRRRNRAAEAREAAERAGTAPARPEWPGATVFLECGCGTRAGFRVLEPFELVKARIMARAAGWRVTSETAQATCPWCVELEAS